MADSPYIFDATEANFETDVINASFEQPQLVDFWAAWCAPCRSLGPVLEKLAGEFAGGFRLAKVDADAQGQLAGMFGIRSLPTVVLVKDGQIVDGFQGAQPEGVIRQFLAKHAIAAGEPMPEEIEQIEGPQLSPEQLIAHYQQEIAAHPDKSELKLDLALALMQSGNAAAAEAELDRLPANLAGDARATRLRGQLDFARALEGAPSAGDLRARIASDAADFEAHDLLGIRLLLDGEPAAGLDEFLHILKSKRDWNEGQAKKRLIAAFNVLEDADLVGTYRRKMASVLF
jgi:putative thioredoxin